MEGLGLHLYDVGITGRTLNWLRDFMRECIIQVRVVTLISSEEGVADGNPQGSARSYST